MSTSFNTKVFGYVSDIIQPDGAGGLVVTGDLNLNGNNITGVNDLTVNGCLHSDGASVHVCDDLLVDGKTTTTDLEVLGSLAMPTAQPTNTTNLFNFTSGAGAPTSVGILVGSTYYDTVAKNFYIFDGTSWVINGNGTVKSVDLTAPADVFTVGGNPITETGTLTLTKVSQPANQAYLTPNGLAGVPSFRSIVLADLPTLPIPSWANVLLSGATSGASNPIIDALQYLAFASNIRISGGGIAPSAGGLDCVQIGRGAAANGDHSTAVGEAAFLLAGSHRSSAFGYNSYVNGHTDSTAFNGASTTANNQVQICKAADTVNVLGRLTMPSGVVTGSTNLLSITSGAGTPTSVGVAAGSLFWDTVGQRLWAFDTSAGWISPTAAFGAAAWSASLAAGASSGANSPIISTGQALRFQTAGTINTVSGADDITVNLGAGKTFYSDKTLTSLQQNGGAAHSSSIQTIAAGGPALLIGSAWVSDYSYDDSGATVVDTANYLISLRKTNANYQVNFHIVVRSDIIPLTVLFPHNATAFLEWADDGISPSIFETGKAWFQPNALAANTEFSINISTTIRTTGAVNQWIQASLVRPPNGRYAVQSYRLSAFLIN